MNLLNNVKPENVMFYFIKLIYFNEKCTTVLLQVEWNKNKKFQALISYPSA